MGCIVQIVLAIVAFAIHPIIGIIYVIAQIIAAMNKNK
jgi:hypothetical protein